MTANDSWVIISGQPALSMGIWVFLVMMALYMGRNIVHSAISVVLRIVYSSFRFAARSLTLTEKKLQARNKEVLMELGREQVERQLEREFFRVNAVVEKDLGGYPKLQRVISDQITRIEEDYKQSGQVAPPPPDWVQAVEAVAKLHLDAKGNGVAVKVLKSIHEASVEQQKEALEEYRKTMSERHTLLHAMLPYWRKLTNTIDEVGNTMQGLAERAKDIDDKMTRYEEIRAGTDKAERTLRASSITQFFVSLFVVAIAVGGAIINFNLIALPMSEMVGAASRIGAYKISDIAALVIIFVEISMGLYLMEALRFTKLFPIIGAMNDRMRRRMIWVTFSILFTLACMESSLAFMRDQIAADLSALRLSLTQANGAAMQAESAVNSWIPMVGQMIMGFVLPFALTFVAIPLESLVHGARTLFGDLLVLLVRSLAFVLRLIGNIVRHLEMFVTRVYDMFIFVPLWVEGLIRERAWKKQLSESNGPQPAVAVPKTAWAEEVAQ